jgi:hypothetical protein
MALKNSRFRIVRRRPTDPHGVDGYFIHELYVDTSNRVTTWKAAGLSLGASSIDQLKEDMKKVLEAFNYPPIEHSDLHSGFLLQSDDPKVVKATLSIDPKKIEGSI